MDALSDGSQALKFVHTYGVGLHSEEAEPDFHDRQWQKRQVDDFVETAVEAEELGFDGLTVTEHHTPRMTCPSPHLLLAAAAVRTSRIRLGSAVTILPLYHPLRVAEEAGTLDLLSGGRFELGLGRGAPTEGLLATGRDLTHEELNQGWLESLEVLHLALTERDFTYDGQFYKVTKPTTLATRPLQDPLPVWMGGASLNTMALAAERGWNIMRNFGSNQQHREALDHYVKTAADHGHTRSGANMMVERFIAIGTTEQEAERSHAKLKAAMTSLIKVFTASGRVVPPRDAEFHAPGQGPKKPPSIVVSGTPDQMIDDLQKVIDETGARRLLVELFTSQDRHLFAKEVMPALKERNAHG